MSKTHQINLPVGAKGWTIINMDPEERKILKNNIEELLDDATSAAEDSLYSDDRIALSTATLRLCEAMQSLVAGLYE
jgi:hypothetical protein|tara:strand:+ start:203 stop:433 length:231 start_codon:yes stop_codon:yes gene_type:complete